MIWHDMIWYDDNIIPSLLASLLAPCGLPLQPKALSSIGDLLPDNLPWQEVIAACESANPSDSILPFFHIKTSHISKTITDISQFQSLPPGLAKTTLHNFANSKTSHRWQCILLEKLNGVAADLTPLVLGRWIHLPCRVQALIWHTFGVLGHYTQLHPSAHTSVKWHASVSFPSD